MNEDLKPHGRKLSFFQTISAVLWSFVGLRRGSDYQQDMAKLNPVHLVIAALLLAGCFVLVLILIVRAVVA
jgi:amino acid transporter